PPAAPPRPDPLPHRGDGARPRLGVLLPKNEKALKLKKERTSDVPAGSLRLALARQQTLTLRALTSKLTGATHGFRLLAGLSLGGLLVMVPELQLPENTLALHLLLERLEGLIDVVVANEYLHAVPILVCPIVLTSNHEQPHPL